MNPQEEEINPQEEKGNPQEEKMNLQEKKWTLGPGLPHVLNSRILGILAFCCPDVNPDFLNYALEGVNLVHSEEKKKARE